MNTPYNPFSLNGKTILVTGASSGIGRATAIECSRMGANVIITGRNENRLQETYDMLDGSSHQKVVVDLNHEEAILKVTESMPTIDGIVHSAGIVKTLPFHFINGDDLKEVFTINFVSPVLLSQKIIKAKKLSKGGSIVFISSIDGTNVAHIGNSLYSSSKGAVNSMVRSMALELSAKKIRVNCVSPGMINTPLIFTEAITQEQIESEAKLYPLKRYGKPEEIAYAVVYLLSDACSWVTGTNLIIDGGFTLT